MISLLFAKQTPDLVVLRWREVGSEGDCEWHADLLGAGCRSFAPAPGLDHFVAPSTSDQPVDSLDRVSHEVIEGDQRRARGRTSVHIDSPAGGVVSAASVGLLRSAGAVHQLHSQTLAR